MTGSGPGFEAFKADYDARGPGKEIFGFVDIGINPNVKLCEPANLATGFLLDRSLLALAAIPGPAEITPSRSVGMVFSPEAQ